MDRRRAERFAAGDRDTVRDVYREYATSVFGLAMRVLHDRGLAEEAVQMTFLNAWRGALRFDPDRELGPWIYTIARRATIDIYRRERRHRVVDAPETDIAVLPPSIEATWDAWQVRQALSQVPEDEREIVRCTHFLGLTHVETAEYLGIPVGTVKSRSHRAHRRLAGLLGHLREVAG